MKYDDTPSGNPAASTKRPVGFPSPPHDGFGFWLIEHNTSITQLFTDILSNKNTYHNTHYLFFKTNLFITVFTCQKRRREISNQELKRSTIPDSLRSITSTSEAALFLAKTRKETTLSYRKDGAPWAVCYFTFNTAIVMSSNWSALPLKASRVVRRVAMMCAESAAT